MLQQKLSSKDYQISITVQANREAVFRALTKEIELWWGNTDAVIEEKGAIFTVSWGEPWYQFKVIDYQENVQITWECIDANQIIGNLEGVEKEWVGTKLYWEIKPIDQTKVQLSLIHQGLVPKFICYDVCSSTWDSYIGLHLKKYLERR